jgi:hypothetical protein
VLLAPVNATLASTTPYDIPLHLSRYSLTIHAVRVPYLRLCNGLMVDLNWSCYVEYRFVICCTMNEVVFLAGEKVGVKCSGSGTKVRSSRSTQYKAPATYVTICGRETWTILGGRNSHRQGPDGYQ